MYDNDSNVIAFIDPEGGRSTTLYNAAGQTVSSIDARDFRTTTIYNADGQSIEFIDARGCRTTSVYDTGGRPASTVDARSNRSTTIFNSSGQTVAQENALGHRWTTVFNNSGQPVASVDPLGNRASSVYDTAGRVVAGVNPLGHRNTTVYNIASQVVASENALGHRMTSIYDANGRPLAEISALGHRTTTVFDDAGRRTVFLDARSNRHSFTYDAAGQETERIDPPGRRTTFGYDAAGQLDRRTDARGNRTTYTYGDNGQLTSRRYPDGTRATFTYDATGNRTLMANATGRYSYSYDGNSQTTVAANPKSKTITYAYDAVGNRAHMDAPDAGRFTYIYDATNQITLLHNAFDERTSFAYDDAGRRTVKKLGNGTRASYTYDVASNLTNLHNLKSDSSVISSFDYHYNDINNRVAVGEANGDRVTWTYDDSNQLTSEHRSGASAYRNTFVYDPVGNRLVLNEDGIRTTTVFDGASQIEYSESAAGRTTYTFDTDGNQQIVEQPDNNRTTSVWDYENRMTSVILSDKTRSTMTYQPNNLRVTSNDGTSTNSWLWDDQSCLSRTDEETLVLTNVPGRYGDLVSQSSGMNSNWCHLSARGDVTELSDSDETIVATRQYEAGGLVLESTGTVETPFQFIGKLGYLSDDTAGGLIYVRARWYAPATQRWQSVDPLYLEHSTEAYSYARRDPINTVDPSGQIPHKTLCDCFKSTCQRIKDEVLKTNDATIKKIWHRGLNSDPGRKRWCQLPEFKCNCRCVGSAFGLYSPDNHQVTVCFNNIRGRLSVPYSIPIRQIILHELIHALDRCANSEAFETCRQTICSEIRAADYSGQCAKGGFYREDDESEEECVIRSAVNSTVSRGPCLDEFPGSHYTRATRRRELEEIARRYYQNRTKSSDFCYRRDEDLFDDIR